MEPSKQGNFNTTRWTLVIEAGDTSSSEATEALGELFKTYWYPLYCYVRKSGRSPDDSQELVQSFFVHILEKNVFRVADRKRGKFRWFLLATFKHFLSNERRTSAALKRGGPLDLLSLDELQAEQRYLHEPVDSSSADLLYDRQWALTLLQAVQKTLQDNAPNKEKFRQLEQYLPGGGAPPQADVAGKLGMTVGALKVEIHRLKKRYAEAMRAEVARTVAHEDEIDGEIQYLIDAIFRK